MLRRSRLAAPPGQLHTDSAPTDLVIRIFGEQRISTFLVWQSAYTEPVISPVLWPVFGRQQFFDGLLQHQRRDRHSGRVSA